MSLSLRLILGIVPVLGLSIAMIVAQISLAQERHLRALSEARADFVLDQLETAATATLQLGVPLADARIMQDLIERAVASDASIIAVDVFTPRGDAVFSTDRGNIGQAVPEAWIDTAGAARNGAWRLEAGDEVVLGQPITNDFGEVAGQIALLIVPAVVTPVGDRAADEQDALALALTTPLAALVIDALAVFAVILVVVALWLVWWQRWREAYLNAVKAIIQRNPGAIAPKEGDTKSLIAIAHGAVSGMRAADQDIDAVQTALEELERRELADG